MAKRAQSGCGTNRESWGEAMADLVGTCPKDFWLEWIAEGDAAGEPYTGEEWGWYTRSPLARTVQPGDRFYVVAHGLLRGWAPVTRVEWSDGSGIICRRGGGVACTVPFVIPGFRGLRQRWWNTNQEMPFPDWRIYGLPQDPRRNDIGGLQVR